MEHENVETTALQRAIAEGKLTVVLDLLKNLKNSEEQIQNSELIRNWGDHFADCDLMEKLKELGCGINDRCEKGFTPLHWAAYNCRLDAVKSLLEEEADVKLKSNRGFTVIHSVAKAKKNVEPDAQGIIDELFNYVEKDEVDARDRNGDTPLIWAATFGRIETVKKLLEYNADLNATNNKSETALHWAARKGHALVVEHLIYKGADINAKDKYGDTPLTWASSNGKGDVVMKLIEKGAEVDMLSYEEYTPLHWAAYYGKWSVVENLLKESKLKLNTKGRNGQQAIHRAVSNRDVNPSDQLEVVKLLIDNGSKINAVDDNGDTPLVYAIRDGHFEILDDLVKMHADLMLKNKFGATILHWAAICDNDVRKIEWVKEKCIFNVNVKDNSDRTPLFWAVCLGDETIVSSLVNHSASVNCEDRLGLTPLHWAAIKGHVKIMEKLADTKGCLNSVDNDGLTPLQLLVSTKK